MINKQRDLNDLFVVGKSALFPYSNCDICDNIVQPNYHERCLEKEWPKKSERYDGMRVPDEHTLWCLSDHHLGDSLRSVNELSNDINAVRYGDGDESPEINPSPIHAGYLAERFFPVTLGTSHEIDEQLPPPWTLTFSPPATGLPRPVSPWRVATPHNRSELHRSWVSTHKHLDDTRIFMHDNPQFRPDTEASLLQTPYQPELSRLRLERLRLEEEILMEVKRQGELERIRGPQPKWYELRNSRFHYEAKKNNELLRSCNSWQDLFDYRSQLKLKSDEFNRKYYPMNKTYDPTNYISVS